MPTALMHCTGMGHAGKGSGEEVYFRPAFFMKSQERSGVRFGGMSDCRSAQLRLPSHVLGRDNFIACRSKLQESIILSAATVLWNN